MQVFQIVHSAFGMGMVNEFRWAFMTSMDFKDENLRELTFETQLIPSIFKHNFLSNDRVKFV